MEQLPQQEYIFALPEGYSAKHTIVRRVNINFVIILLFIISILTIVGAIGYNYFFNRLLTLNYPAPTYYIAYVSKTSGMDYVTTMQQDGLAGYEYDNKIIAKVFNNQPSAIMFVETLVNQYPNIMTTSIKGHSIHTKIQDNQEGNTLLEAIRYHSQIIKKLNIYTDELAQQKTSIHAISIRLKNLSSNLATQKNKLLQLSQQLHSNMDIEQLLSNFSTTQSILNQLITSPTTSSINNATCKIYLDNVS